MQNFGGQIRCIMGNKWCMGGKRLDKNSVRIRKRAALLFENVQVSGALQDFANSRNYGFKTLMDIIQKSRSTFADPEKSSECHS